MKKLLILLVMVTGIASCSRQYYAHRSPHAKASEMIRPPYLKEGDVIGIVAASGKNASRNDSLLIDRLESWGLKIKFGENLHSEDSPFFAGTDKQRASDFQKMINDKEVKAILLYRGGYGAVRILDMVDFGKLRRNPKWVAGYSDVTMLHYAVQKQGVESIHGTMPVSFRYDSTKTDVSAESLREALFGKLTRYELPPHPLNQKGKAEGRLTGGNLSLVYAAAGTDVDNDLSEPSVLFIEDLNEYEYHLDRMLQNLKRSGKLARVKAVVVGYFTDMKNVESFGKGPEELISEYTSKYKIPVIFGFPAGHDRPNYALYFGRMVRVEVTKNGSVLEFL